MFVLPSPLSDASDARWNLLCFHACLKKASKSKKQVDWASWHASLVCLSWFLLSHACVLYFVDRMIFCLFVFNNPLNWYPDESWLTPSTHWLSSLFRPPETPDLSRPRMLTVGPFASLTLNPTLFAYIPQSNYYIQSCANKVCICPFSSLQWKSF